MYVYEFATGWWQARLKAYLYDIRNGTPEEAAAALKDLVTMAVNADRWETLEALQEADPDPTVQRFINAALNASNSHY